MSSDRMNSSPGTGKQSPKVNDMSQKGQLQTLVSFLKGSAFFSSVVVKQTTQKDTSPSTAMGLLTQWPVGNGIAISTATAMPKAAELLPSLEPVHQEQQPQKCRKQEPGAMPRVLLQPHEPAHTEQEHQKPRDRKDRASEAGTLFLEPASTSGATMQRVRRERESSCGRSAVAIS